MFEHYHVNIIVAVVVVKWVMGKHLVKGMVEEKEKKQIMKREMKNVQKSERMEGGRKQF